MPLEGAELADFLSSRAGRLTGSRMADAMRMKKDGTPSQDRANLMRDLLAERLTGLSTRHYVSPAMQWGLDHEDEAKLAYQAETGVFISPCRFAEHPTIENFGATSDGLIAPNGLIEFKCPTTGVFIEWVRNGVVPDDHKPQMLTQIACYRRPWCEFVAFDPRILSAKRRLFIRRYEPKPEEIAEVEAAAIKFLAELDEAFDAFVSVAA